MIKYLEGDFNMAIKNKRVLIDFYADWCGPCKMMSSILEKITSIDILKVNIDRYPDVASFFNVMSIPTLILFDNSKPLKIHVGLMNEVELNEFIH